MRDKYSFVPDLTAPLSHQAIQTQIQQEFAANKVTRKNQIATDQLTMSTALGQLAPNVPSILHTFEQNYLQHGGDWNALSTHIVQTYAGVVTFVIAIGHIDICATVVGVTHRIGRAVFGMHRFVPLNPQPIGVPVQIYVRDEDVTQRHYIFLPNSGTHVRRFVSRGLNGFDGMRLTQNQGLLAAHVNPNAQQNETGGNRHAVALIGNALSVNEQILSHTRGWGKRFVSTGISNHPVYSTRGTQFTSMYGVATIDLAFVPGNIIHDVHLPHLASTILNRPTTDVVNLGPNTGTNDIAEQQYLALRDVLRTRELLIYGQIPLNAIRTQVSGQTLIGIGSQTNNEHHAAGVLVNGLPLHLVPMVVGQDATTFREQHTGRKWHFVEFANPFACTLAYNAFVMQGRQIKVKFNKYSPQRPPGMV